MLRIMMESLLHLPQKSCCVYFSLPSKCSGGLRLVSLVVYQIAAWRVMGGHTGAYLSQVEWEVGSWPEQKSR